MSHINIFLANLESVLCCHFCHNCYKAVKQLNRFPFTIKFFSSIRKCTFNVTYKQQTTNTQKLQQSADCGEININTAL